MLTRENPRISVKVHNSNDGSGVPVQHRTSPDSPLSSRIATIGSDPRITGPEMNTPNFGSVLDGVTTVVALATCAVVLWSSVGRAKPRLLQLPLPKDPVSLLGAPVEGSEQATVAVIEYSDFQCPFCGRFARDVWPMVESSYVRTGKVRFAFRYFPLNQIHPRAERAAEAAECAARQGKFWLMHNVLFRSQDQLDDADLVRDAEGLSLDKAKFNACLAGPAAATVAQDLQSGQPWVRGTPSFLLGPLEADGRVRITARLSGLQSLATFQQALEPLLLKQPSKPSSH